MSCDQCGRAWRTDLAGPRCQDCRHIHGPAIITNPQPFSLTDPTKEPNMNTTATRTAFIAGAPNRPGTNLPSNVTGDCPHLHRSAAAAQRCIDAMDRAIKRGHGQSAYCDRSVVEVEVTNGQWGHHITKLGPSHHETGTMTAEQLAAAVTTIGTATTERDRLIMVMRAEGASLRQIGAACGMSAAGVKKVVDRS